MGDLVFWGLPQPLTQGLQPIRQSGSVIPGSTEPHKRIRVAQTTRQGPDVSQPVKPVRKHWSPVTGATSTRHLVATERGIGLPPSTWEQPPQCPRARVDQAVSTGHGSLERSSLKRPSLRSVRSPGPGRAKLARVPTERNSSLPYGIERGSDKGSDRLSVQGGWGHIPPT